MKIAARFTAGGPDYRVRLRTLEGLLPRPVLRPNFPLGRGVLYHARNRSNYEEMPRGRTPICSSKEICGEVGCNPRYFNITFGAVPDSQTGTTLARPPLSLLLSPSIFDNT